VKAAFPLNLEADYATYEIPAVLLKDQLSPKPQLAGKVGSSLRWADLSATGYGVSLLNDCKYGYDSQPTMRLTLLRSASWPDPGRSGLPRFHASILIRQLAISPHS